MKQKQELTAAEEGMLRKHSQKGIGYVARLTDLPASCGDEDVGECPPAPDLSRASAVTRSLEAALRKCNPSAAAPLLKPPQHAKDLLVLGGYQHFLVGALRRDDVTYSLGTTVKSVRCGADGATVTTATGQKLRADAVVSTLPLGVMKGASPETAVEFVPPLSDRYQESLSRLRMGAHNKVVLRFRPADVFWPPQEPLLNCTDPRFQWCALHAYGVAGVLLTHVWPPFSFDLAALTDGEVVAEVLQCLRRMFPRVPDPIETKVTRWHQDPFSMGSYGYVPNGASHSDITALAEPHPPSCPQVFFAGEATTLDGFQCVAGAYTSGQRAAQQVVGLMRLR
eukprot:TRINITY_DN3484_c0_g1_i1.p1 TRINITY_DN3484_c0_g1~~TRINITY_DN3484_c0_g1_i1.p1  ORF type:complete len:338 (+),score=64.67 TRINITY_DN3484_c0_g1_i1:579-1592(+)